MGTSPYALYLSNPDSSNSGQKKSPATDTTSNATDVTASRLRMAHYDGPVRGGERSKNAAIRAKLR